MRRAHHLKLIAGLLATGLVVTACGSSGTAATTAASSAGSAASSAASSAMGSGMTSSSAASSAPSSAGSSASGSSASGSSVASSGPASSGAVEPFPAITGDAASVKLGMAYDGPKGDQSFTDSAARGVEAATAEGVELIAELAASVGEPEQAKVDRLSQLADQGANTIIAVGFDYATAMGQVAAAYPEVHFAIVDDSSLADVPNVASLTFAAEQGSFLVGAAAALKSEAGHIGFIGGVNTPLIQSFEAGYDAGAKAVKADITIDASYITEPPDFSGFNAPDKGETIANGMYSGGADIVYSAAGGSGTGVFKSAKAAGKLAIGVDSDQYNLPTLADVKDVILTSAVKNVDVAVYAMIASVADGAPLTGTQVYDLSNGGVGFATSGGFVDDIKTQLDEYQAKIISGEIVVPATLS